MFSAKFNFFNRIISTPTPSSSGTLIYMTIDYVYQGQPFVNIIASDEINGTINTKAKQCSLDYVYQGSPFYGNNINFLRQS